MFIEGLISRRPLDFLIAYEIIERAIFFDSLSLDDLPEGDTQGYAIIDSGFQDYLVLPQKLLKYLEVKPFDTIPLKSPKKKIAICIKPSW